MLSVEPKPSEHWSYQLDCLKKATEGPSPEKTRENRLQVGLVYSDTPARLDATAVYSEFKGLNAVAKDPLHIALSIEKPGHGKARTPLSAELRKCVYKFRHAADDGLPYYRAGNPLPASISLKDTIRGMSGLVARRRVKRINRPGYSDMAYFTADEFVLDVAALAVTHPNLMRRRVKKTTTVISTLAHATSAPELQYLLNGPRYVAQSNFRCVHWFAFNLDKVERLSSIRSCSCVCVRMCICVYCACSCTCMHACGCMRVVVSVELASRFTCNGSCAMFSVAIRNVSREGVTLIPYGTTGCEAVHAELVNYFSRIVNQTARHARVKASMFTLRKLMQGDHRLELIRRVADARRHLPTHVSQTVYRVRQYTPMPP